jgi:hypothetical protein
MSNTKHTQGPWSYKVTSSWGSGSILGGDRKGIAAIASSIKRPCEENLANAALIVAAPRMLAALRLVAAMHAMPNGIYQDHIGAMGAVRAALAAALDAEAD